MGRTRKPIDPLGQSKLLLKTLKKQKPGWEKERLLALKLIIEGKDTQVVADLLGRSQSTLQLWINKFRQGGIEELLTRKAMGHKVN